MIGHLIALWPLAHSFEYNDCIDLSLSGRLSLGELLRHCDLADSFWRVQAVRSGPRAWTRGRQGVSGDEDGHHRPGSEELVEIN